MSEVRGLIRLVPDTTNPALGLSRDEALTEASQAFTRAKKAQSVLVSNLHLTGRLTDPGGMVNHSKLRGMRRQAEEQVERAQAVVVALIQSMEALERYSDPKPSRDQGEDG